MKTKPIDEIIRHYAMTEGYDSVFRNDYYYRLYEKDIIKIKDEILSSLKSMRDEKEDNISVREFVIKWGQEGIYDKTFEKDVLKLVKSQSSPQPQPGRGADRKEIEDLMTVIWIGGQESLINGMSFDKSLHLDGSSTEPDKMTVKDVIDTLIKMIEEYRTQSEGKDSHVCKSCGTPLSDYCDRCKHLWAS